VVRKSVRRRTGRAVSGCRVLARGLLSQWGIVAYVINGISTPRRSGRGNSEHEYRRLLKRNSAVEQEPSCRVNHCISVSRPFHILRRQNCEKHWTTNACSVSSNLFDPEPPFNFHRARVCVFLAFVFL